MFFQFILKGTRKLILLCAAFLLGMSCLHNRTGYVGASTISKTWCAYFLRLCLKNRGKDHLEKDNHAFTEARMESANKNIYNIDESAECCSCNNGERHSTNSIVLSRSSGVLYRVHTSLRAIQLVSSYSYVHLTLSHRTHVRTHTHTHTQQSTVHYAWCKTACYIKNDVIGHPLDCQPRLAE